MFDRGVRCPSVWGRPAVDWSGRQVTDATTGSRFLIYGYRIGGMRLMAAQIGSDRIGSVPLSKSDLSKVPARQLAVIGAVNLCCRRAMYSKEEASAKLPL